MKKLVLVLLLLLGAQTYGVYGAWQAERILYRCTLEVGPLCYAWQETTLVKALGKDNAEKLEGKLKAAKDAFEEDFIERLSEKKRSGGLQGALEKVEEVAKEGLQTAKEAAEEALGDD